MSLTIQQPIATVLAAYKPINYYFIPDTTTGRDNYRVRVYVKRESDDVTIGEKWITNTNSSGYFQCDISNILQTQLSYDLPTGTETIISSADGSVIKYYLDAYEYWDVAGILTLQTGSVTSSDKYGIAATTVPASTSFLTDMSFIYADGYGQTALVTDETTGMYVVIKAYKDTTLQSTTTYNLASGDTIDQLLLIPINNTAYSSDSTSIVIEAYDSLAVLISESKTLTIRRKDCGTSVMFKNRYGQFDYYTFTFFDEDYEIERSQVLNDLIYSDAYISTTHFNRMYGSHESSSIMEWVKQMFTSRLLYTGGEQVAATNKTLKIVDTGLIAVEMDLILNDEYNN